MGISEKILNYLSIHEKENKYRLASALKIDAWEVTKALSALEGEGKIEIKDGRAILVKEKEPITAKIRKRKRQSKVEKDETEEKPEEEPGSGLEKEQPEETPTEEGEEVEEEPEETIVKEEAREEEITKEEAQETEAKPEEGEERIEGTVKFFNPDKGFGFITGDDGEEYYVHKSALKEGVTIEADNRVSFKVVQGDKGPKAEEVEWISQA